MLLKSEKFSPFEVLALKFPAATAKTSVSYSVIPKIELEYANSCKRVESVVLEKGSMMWSCAGALPITPASIEPLRVDAMFSTQVGLGNS